MTATTISIFIALLLAGIAIGTVVGSLWVYGQYRHIYDYDYDYDRLPASLISRMQRAMRSCGYSQDEIDRVTHRMGCKIMPSNIPCPPPHEKPETQQDESIE